MNLWNDAASRHRKLMTVLMTFPGIVLITARGGEVAAVEDGRPVEGKKAYRVEGHKSLAYDASCWVRLARDARPVVVGARSVHSGVRPGIDPPQALASDWSLEWLIFDVLKCDPAEAHAPGPGRACRRGADHRADPRRGAGQAGPPPSRSRSCTGRPRPRSTTPDLAIKDLTDAG